MKITKIEAFKVFVPWQDSLKEPMREWRKIMPGNSPEEEDAYAVVKVHTDEGLIGLGEGGRDVEEVKRQGEAFIGKNPLELKPFSMQRPWAMALFDLAGKALGVPLYQLLGTKVHDDIPFAWWSPYMAPEGTGKLAEEGAARGFKVHKIKARPWDAVDHVKAIHAGAGDALAIRIDPNCHFEQPAVAVKIARQIESYNIECFEDPVSKDRPEWNRLIREKTTVPVALHDTSPINLLNHIRADAADFVNIGGSVENIFRAAHICESAGIPVWLQTEGHCYDLQAAFNCHVNAVIPNATLAQDTLPFLREASIVTEPLWPTDGAVKVPEGPGLGVDLDEEMIGKYRVG